MDIIKNANILDHDDITLLENHSLDKKYSLKRCTTRNNVTRLMILVNLLHKYPHSLLNNVIKEYIKYAGNEVYHLDQYEYSALEMCSRHNHIDTAKILLNTSANINSQRKCGRTLLQIAISECNYDIAKLLLSYDATAPVNMNKRISNMINDITLLNAKN